MAIEVITKLPHPLQQTADVITGPIHLPSIREEVAAAVDAEIKRLATQPKQKTRFIEAE